MLATLLAVLITQPPPPGPLDSVALVWGGGKTEAEAAAFLQRWRQESEHVAMSVDLAAAFPQVKQSADVAGLNPGFSIVLLGVCAPAEAVELRRHLKHLYPFVYEKPVGGLPRACPRWKEAAPKLGLQSQVQARGFSAALVARTSTESNPAVQEERTTEYLVIARDAAGQETARWTQRDTVTTRSEVETGCTSTVATDARGFTLTTTCTEWTGAFCNRYPGARVVRRLTLSGADGTLSGRVVQKTALPYNAERDCAQ